MDEKVPSTSNTSHASGELVQNGPIKPQARAPYDQAVTFEEYHYYAQKAREEELTYEAPTLSFKELIKNKSEGNGEPNLSEKDFATREGRLRISDEEWTNASRAFRSASWGACEYRLLCSC